MPTGGGGGGGGLSTVSVTARLTGNGTAGSPLNIAGLPLACFVNPARQGGASAPGNVNQVSGCGFILSYALTFANITVIVGTGDAVNNYDLGVYNFAGSLIANIGAQHLPSTGTLTFATLQGSQTIAPGLYTFGFTGNAVTATIQRANDVFSWNFTQTGGASSGGALPASISPLTITPVSNAYVFTLQ